MGSTVRTVSQCGYFDNYYLEDYFYCYSHNYHSWQSEIWLAADVTRVESVGCVVRVRDPRRAVQPPPPLITPWRMGHENRGAKHERGGTFPVHAAHSTSTCDRTGVAVSGHSRAGLGGSNCESQTASCATEIRAHGHFSWGAHREAGESAFAPLVSSSRSTAPSSTIESSDSSPTTLYTTYM